MKVSVVVRKSSGHSLLSRDCFWHSRNPATTKFKNKGDKVMAKVGIVMGSDSDMPVMKKAADMLEKFGIE